MSCPSLLVQVFRSFRRHQENSPEELFIFGCVGTLVIYVVLAIDIFVEPTVLKSVTERTWLSVPMYLLAPSPLVIMAIAAAIVICRRASAPTTG